MAFFAFWKNGLICGEERSFIFVIEKSFRINLIILKTMFNPFLFISHIVGVAHRVKPVYVAQRGKTQIAKNVAD